MARRWKPGRLAAIYHFVIPAKAGIHFSFEQNQNGFRVPPPMKQAVAPE
ncbi:MAG TPA: hypothetical protein VIG31_05050 [Rhodanobacteraceae bacterium]